MSCLAKLVNYIRLVVMDIDGVLTVEKLFYSESGFKFRSFCVRKAHWVGRCKGGNGFVREVADQIISNLGIDPYLPFVSQN